MTALLTIFSAPKPFSDTHINLIQRNAILSWKKLGKDVEIALVGGEEGIKEVAHELKVTHFAGVKTNREGTPLISSIFELGRSLDQSPLLAYINADILLLSDFLATARLILEQVRKFLIVGQRWDLDVREQIQMNSGWESGLKKNLQERGRLHPPMGSDYFIFPRECYQDIPDFAVGRAGWDNWMIFKGRREDWKVIDATGAITVIHQDHDYSHLPKGKPHYRLPESDENIRLAGGKRTVFHLQDCDTILFDGKLTKPVRTWKKVVREIETWPIRRLHSTFLAQLTFTIFHPVKAYKEFRPKLAAMKRKLVKAGE
jgi:hypothetical protein